ncbi:MAG TPA: hypothetical protein VGP55_11900 [Chitinophagaceae bacterium]|nr:hypothetical protein [Chitinophagaceae bacterium]
MAKNQFVVDLGTLKLTDDEHQRINAAIQKVVAGELANLNTQNKFALFPLRRFTKGPILDGIIARDVSKQFQELIK